MDLSPSNLSGKQALVRDNEKVVMSIMTLANESCYRYHNDLVFSTIHSNVNQHYCWLPSYNHVQIEMQKELIFRIVYTNREIQFVIIGISFL